MPSRSHSRPWAETIAYDDGAAWAIADIQTCRGYHFFTRAVLGKHQLSVAVIINMPQ